MTKNEGLMTNNEESSRRQTASGRAALRGMEMEKREQRRGAGESEIELVFTGRRNSAN